MEQIDMGEGGSGSYPAGFGGSHCASSPLTQEGESTWLRNPMPCLAVSF